MKIHSPYTIAIIGGIACGKSSALQFFKDKKIEVFSADIIAKELTQIGTQEYLKIVSKLGPSILQANQELDRSKLRNLLINNSSFKQWLESLLHPKIKSLLLEAKNHAKSPYCVLEIPLLKSKDDYQINRVLCINCSPNTQISRLKTRQLSKEDIQGMLDLQIPFKERIALADDILENNGNLDDFYQKLEDLHQKYVFASSHH